MNYADTRPRSLWQRICYPFRRGTPPQSKEAVGLFTDSSLCIGCKACQVACKHWNLLPAEAKTLTGHSYDNTQELTARTWRHVKFIEKTKHSASNGKIAEESTAAARPHLHWLFLSDSCKHCEEAPCMEACPTGALVRTEFGTVYPQAADICNGCASCVAACPFGVIARDHQSGHSHKCVLCLDRLRQGDTPACAKTCISGSIQFGHLAALRKKAKERLAEIQKHNPHAQLYGHEGTDNYSPVNSFYLLQDNPVYYGLPEKPYRPSKHLRGDYARSLCGVLFALAVLCICLSIGGIS